MSDSSATPPSSPTSGLTDLTLAVRMDGVSEQEVFLQHGLSIGRNPSNTICIDEPDVERIHAMVSRQGDGTMLLECVSEHLSLALPDSTTVHAIPLKPGTTFRVGRATIRCLKRETRPTVLVADNPWQVRCPRCHETIVQLPHDTRACPKCGLELQYFQSQSPQVPSGGPETFKSAPGFEGWLPRQVGPYKIRAFVAQGGMGIILRGLHTETDLTAAVKLLKIIDDADPTWRTRFLAEIDTLKGLRHPNVVRLQDHGKDDKMLWLAMDWIDGQSLTRLLAEAGEARKPLAIEQIRDILTQVASGLKYLHEKGIIHRDLKPSNVLMAQDGLVKMVDFGIARAASGQTSVTTQLTQTGMVAGTESYMSPEQAEGQTITTASDIYSLGVMWYELVVGRRPLGAFAAPHLLRPDCPMAWSDGIARCLAVDPRSRPGLEALQRMLGSLPAEPPPLPAQGPYATRGGRVPGPPPMQPTHTGVTGWQPARPAPSQPIAPGPVGPPSGPPAPGPFQRPGQQPIMPHEPGQSGSTVPPAAAAVMASVVNSAKSAGSAIARSTPVVLSRLGPVGAWVRSHRGPSIGIGAGASLVVIVLMVRACAPTTTRHEAPVADKPDTPHVVNAGNNVVNPNANNPDNVNHPDNNNPNPPQRTPLQMFIQGLAMVQSGPGDARFTQGLDLLRQSADAGYVPAMNSLASIYADQRAGPYYNPQKSIVYLRMAADKGDPQAISALQRMGMWR